MGERLGQADWLYDVDVIGDESNVAMHLPCCSRRVNGRRCGKGPLTGEQIASGDCGGHHGGPPSVNVKGLDASPARTARNMPIVRGLCPACGLNSLFLAQGGYITCASLSCNDPTSATHVLARPRERR